MPSTSTNGSNGSHPQQKWKVAIIGSGNWGSAISKIVGMNVEAQPELFNQNVRMWCFEETFNGRPLTEQFNELHENVKYLPGIKIPKAVVAHGSLVEAVEGADALIFVVPHQFIPSICKQLVGKINPNCRAISLVKGVDVKETKISIFADVIEEQLGISCSALSGANVASEVAQELFSETTIGCRDEEDGKMWKQVFNTNMFRVSVVKDVRGVSLCGALKNVVAIAAGIVDGLAWGNNAKAAIMRIGLIEMKQFSEEFFPGVEAETFVQESAGIADLITSCLGGRNRKVAEAFVKSGKTFDVLEQELLGGQKLQGVETSRELHMFLKARGKTASYPLFDVVYKIAYEGLPPNEITNHI